MERLVRGFIGLVQRLSLPSIRQWGKRLGRIAFYVAVRRRKQALSNLDLVYGNEMTKPEKKDIAKAAFENLLMTALEFMACPALGPNFTDFSDLENIESFWEAYNRGKGVITIVPHMGNWELPPRYLLNTGVVVHAVSRRQRQAWVRNIVSDFRKANGIREIDKRNALRPVITALKHGDVVCMLIDQHSWKDSVETTFMGRPAMTVASPALLALRTGCAVILIASLRKPDGRVIMAASEIIETINTGDRAKDIQTNTQRYVDVIERYVRRSPQSWLWMHRRWRSPIKKAPALV
jgi:KDO2-lipid IV(A) lauroyltransferase